MSFMQRQITYRIDWLSVETTHGTWFVPKDDLKLMYPDSESALGDNYEDAVADIEPYVEGKIQSWKTVKGYGARLSAPGYLDCTEWSVFDTVEEAQEYLDEMYPEDENEEESN